jgi:hypothetical protein
LQTIGLFVFLIHLRLVAWWWLNMEVWVDSFWVLELFYKGFCEKYWIDALLGNYDSLMVFLEFCVILGCCFHRWIGWLILENNIGKWLWYESQIWWYENCCSWDFMDVLLNQVLCTPCISCCSTCWTWLAWVGLILSCWGHGLLD